MRLPSIAALLVVAAASGRDAHADHPVRFDITVRGTITVEAAR